MSKISLSPLYQNHMILQRDKTIIIKGLSTEKMLLTVSFNDTSKQYSIEAGPFELAFPAQHAGRNKTLAFYCNDETTPELCFEDINIGDLYLAAGQSNMEYFMRYDAHWNETSKLPVNSDIRMFNCPQIAFNGQERNLPYSGYWFSQDDEAFREFSAPGFYFAHFLQPDINVPVGIIGCNWGGTPACAWMSEKYLCEEPLNIFTKEYMNEVSLYSEEELKELSLKSWSFEDSYTHQLEWRAMMYGLTENEQKIWQENHKDDPVLPMGPYHHYRPSGLYHTMLEQITPFTIKGILWYQGESDSGHADIYDKTLTAMIQCFRDSFKDNTLPFLLVQLAPFGKWLDCTNDGYAEVRLKQDIVSKNVENVYLTSIMDLGMWEDIHPKEKREVGRRLALLAKGNLYHFPVLCESPEFVSLEYEANTLLLYFRNVGENFHYTGNPAENFEVSIANRNCVIQDISFSGHTLYLKLNEQITDLLNQGKPLSVSYANKNYCEGNIWNDAKLPLKPFHYQYCISK